MAEKETIEVTGYVPEHETLEKTLNEGNIYQYLEECVYAEAQACKDDCNTAVPVRLTITVVREILEQT